ncbi:MAG: PQQ-dependent sugar dehydrogenase [Planctomycetes bacterium]|nr:PQQ-dependent sugar dehydrogenase [Planctomycetota bacterium]
MTHALRDRRPLAAGHRTLRATTVLWLLATCIGLRGADTPTPFDTTKRVAWTTSQVHGTAEPPAAYHVVRVYPKLTLESPVDLRLDAASQRWYVLELNGTVRSFPVQVQGVQPQAAQKPELVLDIAIPGLPERVRRAAYGLVLHPHFAENGQLYVFYREQTPGPPRTRISRFIVDLREPEVVPRARLDSETVICEFLSGEDHFGSSMAFGPDGFLYFSVGDGSGYGDGGESGQDLGDFQASIHRIDVDHPSRGRMYGIPAGNPFTERLGARPEIWAYGLRNIWRMAFDRVTGELWAGDVGQDLWESVFKIERGGNYGWSILEGTHGFRPERPHGPTPIIAPVIEHAHFEARSLIGGQVYRGKRLPELAGAFIYGDYDTGLVWGVRGEAGKPAWHAQLASTALRIVDFAEDADGELLLVDLMGGLYRFEAEDPAVLAAAAGHHFPHLLSETGLFASTAEHRVAPGVIPYSVNSPLWSDGAAKQRFMAIPGDGRIENQGDNGWTFPQDSVLVKTFALDLEAGNPATRKRLETRLLHLVQNTWHGYTYLWNDAQTDAELLEQPAGLDRTYSIRDAKAPGGVREQRWHFPGRAECTLCHTMPANYVLGASTAQLNRDQDYGGGVVANQLTVFDHLGLLAHPLYGQPPAQLARLADPHDAHAPLDSRARAYLQANCAHCHMKYGGGNAYFFLTSTIPLAQTGAVNLDPQHGDLGIPGAKVLRPGDPDHSLMLARMAALGPLRMPRIASNVVDQDGVALIRAWIAAMPRQ